MRSTRARLVPTTGPKWLLVLLAPALVIGIVTMHSLLVQPHDHARPAATSAVVAAAHADHLPVAPETTTAAVGHEGGHGEHGTGGTVGISDCSGLMAMCMALLVSFAALLLWRLVPSRWVLRQRPLRRLLHVGRVRTAFESLTTLQRTTVIRC